MSHDSINSWVEKAKSLIDAKDEPQAKAVRVIKHVHKSGGNLIMQVADALRPYLTRMFENVRDENGMLVQPARSRGIALNIAQSIVKKKT